MIDKIPYLKDLGVTAVELLPVFQFDPADAPAGRLNYWGYQPVSFFAPHHAYSSRTEPLGVLDEFRDMVKALHRAGIEVILDVVFNHTTEGSERGPTLCHRGLANEFYYILQNDKSRYADFTGCGNTLNANQPIVRRMIQDSLRYWVTQMHVDGFRFDLASILSRDESGHPLQNPPVLWDIESDPLLAGTKLIAEAWDAAGLYQVGTFVGDTWQEWNGRFRDDVRRFWKGDEATVPRLATRLLGSPDLFGHEEREAEQSINFVTCHDGFTLNDLVSYDRKHNEANGEDNRDGTDDNLSWNCGVEGPTDDPEVEALRDPAGQEPPDRAHARGGRADAADGRRGPPQPGRQQQRVLPGRRGELARLAAAGAARRPAPLRQVPVHLPPAARRRGRQGVVHPERAPAVGPHRVARRGAGPARLERPLAFARVHGAHAVLARSLSTPCSTRTGSRSPSICRGARTNRTGGSGAWTPPGHHPTISARRTRGCRR